MCNWVTGCEHTWVCASACDSFWKCPTVYFTGNATYIVLRELKSESDLLCSFVCVWGYERECVCVCVCVCYRKERDRQSKPASVGCVLKLERFTCKALVLLHLNLGKWRLKCTQCKCAYDRRGNQFHIQVGTQSNVFLHSTTLPLKMFDLFSWLEICTPE